jgi:dTDP-4-dehydrorhamnose 3,5-epimerase
MIEVEPALLDGVLVVTHRPVTDHRGSFMRVMDAATLAAAGIDHTSFVQENQSRSCRSTIRGLHGSSVLREAKLVRCVRGRVYDVAVDMRPWSRTFGCWQAFDLDEEHPRQVYIPAGFLHGFAALTDIADVHYRVDSAYQPELELAVSWDDAELGIPWPVKDPVLSDRDAAGMSFAEALDIARSWSAEAAR